MSCGLRRSQLREREKGSLSIRRKTVRDDDTDGADDEVVWRSILVLSDNPTCPYFERTLSPATSIFTDDYETDIGGRKKKQNLHGMANFLASFY